jgi:A/G-specific adenine glycosylase
MNQSKKEGKSHPRPPAKSDRPTPPSAEKRFLQVLGKEGLTARAVRQFRTLILRHYATQGRPLPWRETSDPYAILVSEIMLQQTQVERVREKYPLFLAAFPDFPALAHAPLQEVLKVWVGLGYNRRAQALQKIAATVVKEYQGSLPSSATLLGRLPGIGNYTASALMVFAFNQPVVLLETNIRTAFIHFFFRDDTPIPDRELLPLIDRTMDRSDPRTWYNALMDYGVTLKKLYGNPARKSAHYRPQSPFVGSTRQIRGAVLRLLTEETSLGEKDIIARVGKTPQRVRDVLAALEAEGFIRRRQAAYFIP